MSITYLDQLTTEVQPLSSDRLLGIRGTGIGAERLFNIDSSMRAAMGLSDINGLIPADLIPPSNGENFIVVPVSESTTTNGVNLSLAVLAASAATPYGNAVSTTNPFYIVLPPAIYDMGLTNLDMGGMVTGYNIVALVRSTPPTVIIQGNNDADGSTVVTLGDVVATGISFRNIAEGVGENNGSYLDTEIYDPAAVLDLRPYVYGLSMFIDCEFIGTNTFKASQEGYNVVLLNCTGVLHVGSSAFTDFFVKNIADYSSDARYSEFSIYGSAGNFLINNDNLTSFYFFNSDGVMTIDNARVVMSAQSVEQTTAFQYTLKNNAILEFSGAVGATNYITSMNAKNADVRVYSGNISMNGDCMYEYTTLHAPACENLLAFSSGSVKSYYIGCKFIGDNINLFLNPSNASSVHMVYCNLPFDYTLNGNITLTTETLSAGYNTVFASGWDIVVNS